MPRPSTRTGLGTQLEACSGVGALSHQAGGGHLSKTAEPGQRGPQGHLFQVQRSRALRGPGLSHQPLQKGPGTFVLDLGASSWGPGGTSLPPQGERLCSLRGHIRTCPGGQWVCGPGGVQSGWGTAERQLRRSWGGWGSEPHPQAGPHHLSSTGEEQVPASAPAQPPAPTPPGRFARSSWSRASAVTAQPAAPASVPHRLASPAPALPQPACSLCQSPLA